MTYDGGSSSSLSMQLAESSLSVSPCSTMFTTHVPRIGLNEARSRISRICSIVVSRPSGDHTRMSGKLPCSIAWQIAHSPHASPSVRCLAVQRLRELHRGRHLARCPARPRNK